MLGAAELFAKSVVLVKIVKPSDLWRIDCFKTSDVVDVITYHHDVTWAILDSSKEAEDDDDDVEEVGKDGGPLVAQKVKNLSFQSQYLKKKEEKRKKC